MKMKQRPLSAYNLFFKVQRYLIIHDRHELRSVDEIDEILGKADQSESRKSSKPQKKRLHRKTHGKIGFADLGKMIGLRWKSCSPEIKTYFNKLASKEKERYYSAQKHLCQYSHSPEETLNSCSSNESCHLVQIEDLDSRDIHESSCSAIDPLPFSNETRSNSVSPLEVASSHPCEFDEKFVETSIEPLPFMPGNHNQTYFHAFDHETCKYMFSALECSLPPN